MERMDGMKKNAYAYRAPTKKILISIIFVDKGHSQGIYVLRQQTHKMANVLAMNVNSDANRNKEQQHFSMVVVVVVAEFVCVMV